MLAGRFSRIARTTENCSVFIKHQRTGRVYSECKDKSTVSGFA